MLSDQDGGGLWGVVSGWCSLGVVSERVVHEGAAAPERELFVDNLLVRIYTITEMIQRTGLAPWVFRLPFPSSLISTSHLLAPSSSFGRTIFLSLGSIPLQVAQDLPQTQHVNLRKVSRLVGLAWPNSD